MYMPTEPPRHHNLDMNVSMGSSPTVQDIMDAFEKIQAKHPNARMSEVSVDASEGGWDSDPYTVFELNFHRYIDNPQYESQMVLYHKAMEAWQQEEHEIQMRINAAYRSSVEQQSAKAEWKKARRAERVANRVTPIGTEKCE